MGHPANLLLQGKATPDGFKMHFRFSPVSKNNHSISFMMQKYTTITNGMFVLIFRCKNSIFRITLYRKISYLRDLNKPQIRR